MAAQPAGVHVAYRKTKHSFYVAAASTLKLPTEVGYRPNDSNSYNGAFPEFFHGFYVGQYGLDTGIMYGEDGNGDVGFLLCFNAIGNTYASGWYNNSVMRGVGKGDTVQLITSFVNGYLKTDCTTASGSVLDSYSIYLTPVAYGALSSGSVMHREITLAMNADESGRAEVPAPAYFKDAEFSRTTLTTNRGEYVKLELNNSNDSGSYTYDPEADVSTYSQTPKSQIGSEDDDGYARDTCSATFDRTSYPV